jgi:UDP-glucuronate decarboxylase
MYEKSKRILVTGGAGFLGSHLCERLLHDGAEVICLDNFYTGQKSKIMHMICDASFTLLEHDITNPIYLQVDEVYNLACPASPVHYQYDPVHTMKTSVLGTINVLGLTKRVGAKLIQASTSEIYGDPQVHPQPESYWGHVNPTGSRACYDEGKRSAETLCYDYRRRHDVEVKVVRIFNTYGPRMDPDDGRVVSNFIVQALRNDPLTIYGDGSQTRSFCYVDDLIEGFIRVMSTNGFYGPVNLGNPDEVTVLELAEKIRDITGSKSALVQKPLPDDDPRLRRPDITLAQRQLNWTPRVPLEEGLVKTISYFDRLLGSNSTQEKLPSLQLLRRSTDKINRTNAL